MEENENKDIDITKVTDALAGEAGKGNDKETVEETDKEKVKETDKCTGKEAGSKTVLKAGTLLYRLTGLIDKLPKKAWIGLSTGVCVLLIIVLVAALLPANRAARNLKKADRFYAEEDYAAAALKYSKAISAKADCYEAYTGLILSDSVSDNDKAEQDLLDANEAVKQCGGVVDSEDTNDLIELYLLAPGLLNDDPSTLISVLETGYEYTDESVDIQNALTDAYILRGEELAGTDMAAALEFFDRVLNVRGTDTSFTDELREYVLKYIDSLKVADQYEEAFEVIEKYGDTLSLDKDSLNAEIQASSDLYDTKEELLKEAYDLMKFYYDLAADSFSEETVENAEEVLSGMLSVGWRDLLNLDGSDAAEEVATSQTQSAYVYAPDGFNENYTGLACGLYTYGDLEELEDGSLETPYYFFFGNYVNGKREGYGFSISKSAELSYYGFEGEWSDDKPNGFGVSYLCNMFAHASLMEYQSATYGNFTNGLEDGVMSTKIYLSENPDKAFKGQFTVSLGVAEEVQSSTDDYEVLLDDVEGRKLIAVIPSVDDGYDFYIPLYQYEGKYLSAIGF